VNGRPHRGQVQRPASNQRWCSAVFLSRGWASGLVGTGLREAPRGTRPSAGRSRREPASPGSDQRDTEEELS